MIAVIIYILVVALVLAVAFFIIRAILNAFAVPVVWHTILWAVLALIFLLVIIDVLGVVNLGLPKYPVRP